MEGKSSFQMDQLMIDITGKIDDILAELNAKDGKWFLKELRGVYRGQ